MSIMVYNATISDALRRKDVSLDRLQTLRKHARAVLDAQGDLKGALRKLEAEISRRGKSGGSTRLKK